MIFLVDHACLLRSSISRVSLMDICQHMHGAILDMDITQCSDYYNIIGDTLCYF